MFDEKLNLMSEWKSKNPTIPAALVEPVKWMLGANSGAELRPFRLADVPKTGTIRGAEDVSAALWLLWDAAVIELVGPNESAATAVG